MEEGDDLSNLVENVRADMRQEEDSPEVNISTMDDLFVVSEPQQPTQSTSRKRTLEATTGEPTKKRNLSKPGPNWAILEPIWPASERPEALRDPEWIEKQSIGDLMTLQKVYQKKEQRDQGQAIGKATKDNKPPAVQFKAETDDCDKSLAAARFQRMPISKPKHWWHKVPMRHTHNYRNIPMKHVLGLDTAVAPAVTLARHDRRNTLQMKHYFRNNVNITNKPMKEIKSKEGGGISTISDFDWALPLNIKQCQDCLLQFAAVNRSLWPYDMTDLALTKVYNRYDWCGVARNDSDRVKLIRAVFNRVMETNAFRAADGEDPMSYEAIEQVLKDLLIGNFSIFRNSVPILSCSDNGLSAEVPQAARPNQQPAGDRLALLEGKLARLEARPRHEGSRDTTGSRDNNRRKTMHNGREVCFHFNSREGCKRPTIPGGCKLDKKEFSHACLAWSKEKKAYCLLPHSKVNHK